jgi:hypothetical protein
MAVVLVQSAQCPEPHEATGVLKDRRDSILRKTVVDGEVFEDRSRILCDAARRETEMDQEEEDNGTR